MRDILVDIIQITIGVLAIIGGVYSAINLVIRNSKSQLITFQEYSHNFTILEKQIDLLKQTVAYQNQLILEKISNLEEKISDIENWLDKHDEYSFIKRRRE